MKKSATSQSKKSPIDLSILKEAYKLMCTAESMAHLYEENKAICSKYVHSTSRGHEAIQLASAFQLKAHDFASPYYRDESILLGIGMQPYELMCQLMAKKDDPFSGGRTYYSHPSLKREGFPTIPHQSSATGMQAIPATGMAQGIAYLESQGLTKNEPAVVLCSIGDGAMTEGEVSEAMQMAILKRLPIVYLVQDNEWGISATGKEMRAMDAYDFAAGFPGLKRMRVQGHDFEDSFRGMKDAFDYVRKNRAPILVHATCPLLGHHTSGVRKEWYRGDEDLEKHSQTDPIPLLRSRLLDYGVDESELIQIADEAKHQVELDYQKALDADEPDLLLEDDEFAPSPITEEKGERSPKGGEKVVMVDAALHAVDEIMSKHPESLFYGQDVGGQLGGVFREAANLAKKYGDERVFNTPIQEAYIIGSTAGVSAVGAKAIVEIQFADYIWPGMNQLVVELAKSYALSNRQFPVQSLIRVPIGAYGGGGPYHSGSVESTLANIRGIKVAYPSTAADIKGLMKSAFYDPNPVVMLEHKGLYWSKVPGTLEAKTIEPDENYVIPFGKALSRLSADEENIENGESILVITYGMGVYWSLAAAKSFEGKVEVLDLRTIHPVDWEAISQKVKQHNKVMVLTEEPLLNSFAESLAGRIASQLFEHLDAPICTIGSKSLPAIPLNTSLEADMLPNPEKVKEKMKALLAY